MKQNSYIEIVGSSNPRLNAMSEESRNTICVVLRRKYAKVGITIVNTFADLEALVAKRPDFVVLGMKLVLLRPDLGYDDSPKVWLSDFLTQHDIGFSGSDTEALQLEFDKPVAKQKVRRDGLKSPAYFVSPIKAPVFDHALQFPLFVKPTNRGDSKGIDEQSVVHTQLELKAKIIAIHASCDSDVLVEEYLPGREFSVAVVEHQSNSGLVAMPIEIVSPADSNGNTFLSAAIKKADLERVKPVIDDALRDSLNALAIGVFRSLGARDYGRIDLRLDATGTPHFIEANLMPGLSNHGYLARCFMLNQHIRYEEMILGIVQLGISRLSSSEFQFADATVSSIDGSAPDLISVVA